jgi:type II secretory pathway component GspD/PulD (secretin)
MTISFPPTMTKDELIETLNQELAMHDWWYMMSDDNRVYISGTKHREKIENIKTKLIILGMTATEINDIHNKYAPEEKQIR